MALHKKAKDLAIIDCNNNPVEPLQSIDPNVYAKLGGSQFGVPAAISGNTVSYDVSVWSYPEKWSEGCGVWDVNSSDQFIGQGTNGGCDLLWNSPADVAATLNSLDPNGLTWTESGGIVSATAIQVDPNVTTYQLATCQNLASAVPSFVDCDGNPLVNIASGQVWYIVYKGNDTDFYNSGGDPATVYLGLVENQSIGIQDWFYGAICASAKPAPVGNWEWTSIASPITAIEASTGNTFSPLTQTVIKNPVPVCTTNGDGITYQVPTCADIADLQAQIDALAASDKYVVSGTLINPNTANATVVLTMSDGSTINIAVGTLEDTITAAQVLALFPNGAATSVTVTGSAIRFLGQDGQWHVLTIPATTNVLASAVNTMTSTVDGVASSAPIINSNALALSGAKLTSTVNGVASNALDLAPVLPVDCAGAPILNGKVTTQATAKDTGLVTNQNADGCATLTDTMYDVAVNSIANASSNGNVASGARSFVGGGDTNVATAINSAVVAGQLNQVLQNQSVIAGGYSNVIDAASNRSFIGAGENNLISITRSIIGAGSANKITGIYSGILAGQKNIANGISNFIGAGLNNVTTGTGAAVVAGDGNQAIGNYSFIGAGVGSIAKGGRNVIGGGTTNATDGVYSTIGGGLSNQALGDYSTVVGGTKNITDGIYAFIGGGVNNDSVGAGSGTVIGGGNVNLIKNGSIYSTIGGGASNKINTLGTNGNSSNYSFIGGGNSNQVDDYMGVIAGGRGNILNTSLYYNAILGGSANQVTGTIQYAAIGGGGLNTINSVGGHSAVIAGGYNNLIDTKIASYYNAIGGGGANKITGDTSGSNTVAGGYNNVITSATGAYAISSNAIGGGTGNTIQSTTATQRASSSVISGGNGNEIRGYSSMIAGGTNNAIGVGGNQNDYLYSAFAAGFTNKIDMEAGATSNTYSIGNAAIGANNTINAASGSRTNIAIGDTNTIRGHRRIAIGTGITASNTAGTTDDSSIFIAGATQKLSFYNVVPVARQALAANPTPAQIRTVLFNLGLVA